MAIQRRPTDPTEQTPTPALRPLGGSARRSYPSPCLRQDAPSARAPGKDAETSTTMDDCVCPSNVSKKKSATVWVSAPLRTLCPIQGSVAGDDLEAAVLPHRLQRGHQVLVQRGHWQLPVADQQDVALRPLLRAEVRQRLPQRGRHVGAAAEGVGEEGEEGGQPRSVADSPGVDQRGEADRQEFEGTGMRVAEW